MDHAVSLVQTYLQLNGYFTSAEYPIMASAGRSGVRSLTDIDILAFRFPAGIAPTSPKRAPKGLDVSDLDPGLGAPADSIDMVIGEVKEGRVGINTGIRDPEVLKVVINRLGDSSANADRAVTELLNFGSTTLPSSVRPAGTAVRTAGASHPTGAATSARTAAPASVLPVPTT